MTRPDWSPRPLGDLCRFQAGSAFPRDEQGWSAGDVPFIKVSDMNLPENTLRIVVANHWVSLETARRLRLKLIPAGATVFAKIGEALKAERLRQVVRPTAIDNNMMAAIAKPAADEAYLRYLLEYVHLAGWAEGSALPYFRQSDLERIPVVVPDLDEQRAIAATLGAFDGKIESNRRATSLLEQIGSAMLEESFAPDAGGLPLYSKTQRLGDILSVLETGSRPRGGLKNEVDGVVSLGAQHVQSAGVCAQSDFGRVPHDYAAAMRRGRLQEEDVLIYKDGGKPGNFIPHVSAFGHGFPVPEAVINEHVYRVRAVDGISQGLLYWLLRSQWMDQEMRKRGTGVAIPGLNSTNVRELPIPRLDVGTVKRLNQQLAPMLAAVLQLGAENRRLASLRDVLVPELLAGRMLAPEAHSARV